MQRQAGPAGAGKPRVIVVGAGFGGLQVARGLAGGDCDVVLIDRANHTLFQPLLYQVATAALAPSDIAVPVRTLFTEHSRVTVLLGEVTGVDPHRKTVSIHDTEDQSYDHLVLATGSAYSWFGHDDWQQHSLALKTLDDAELMRLRLLGAFEWAESRTDPAEIERLLTFVVVGGGPTGVELAGAIAELRRSTLARDFTHIRPRDARVLLFEGGGKLLAGFPEHLSDYAADRLRQLGVEVHLDSPVQTVDGEGIVAGGTRFHAANVFWAAGTRANPAASWLGADAAGNGGLKVLDDCTVPGHPEIFAIGDVAATAGPKGMLPALAPVAKQAGEYVARVIRSKLAGTAHPGPFRYHDAGALAIIGRSAAVADLGKRLRFTGLPAWLLWSGVHLFTLVGARNRFLVYCNWIWAFITYGRGARLMTRAPGMQPEDALRAGQPTYAGDGKA